VPRLLAWRVPRFRPPACGLLDRVRSYPPELCHPNASREDMFLSKIRVELNGRFTMNHSPLLSNVFIWIGIAFCIAEGSFANNETNGLLGELYCLAHLIRDAVVSEVAGARIGTVLLLLHGATR
jgi:hypothetical protein